MSVVVTPPGISRRTPAPQRILRQTVAHGSNTLANSLPPFWLACGLTLIVSHYQIWQRFNIGYKVLGVLIVLMMPLTAGFTRMITRPAVIWLLAFEAVMVVNMFLGRYLPGEIFSTASHPIQLVRALPLMLCGYTLARHKTAEKWFFLLVIPVYAVFSMIEARGFVLGAGKGLGRAEQYSEAFGLDNVRVGAGYVGAFVYFAPLLFFLAIALLRLYPTTTPGVRLGVFAAQAPFIIVGLFSGFGAMLVLVLVATGLLVCFAPVRTLRQRLVITAVGVVAVSGFQLLRSFFSDEVGRGAVFSAFSKISTLATAIFSRHSEEAAVLMELGSSSRWSLMLRSLQTFLECPLFGHGLLNNDDLAVGRHSFFVDTAATFGIVGLIPAGMFFFVLLRGVLRARRANVSSWDTASALVFLGTFIAGNVVNPYFMGMLSLTYFEFLILGFCLAVCERGETSARANPQAGFRPAMEWVHAV
jgi:hypothetical protein